MPLRKPLPPWICKGIVGDLPARCPEAYIFAHADSMPVRRVLLLQLRRGVDEEPGAAQLGGHIRQLEGDALLGRDGLAELDALLGIAQRVLKRALGDAQRLRGDADASAVQRGHGNLEASPSLPNRFSLGTFTSLKISSAVEEERIPILS